MRNKAKYTRIIGMLDPHGNAKNFIGMKDGALTTMTQWDFIETVDIGQRVPFSINSCSNDFIKPYGVYAYNNTITVNPLELEDSSGQVVLSLKETISKTTALFAEGNNNGCKDGSYGRWHQPRMTSETTPYGRCYYSTGATPSADQMPWKASDGILDNTANEWLVTSTNVDWIFTDTEPFIVETLYLHNTEIENRSRDVDIFVNANINNKVLENYFCNPDAYATSVVNIPKENRVESTSIGVLVKTAFSGTTVGFNEIEIRAKTKYVQPDTFYNVFLIGNEDLSKIDVIISENQAPMMPTGFENGYYALISHVQTDPIYKTFRTSLSNGVEFNMSERPLTITNCLGETAVINGDLDVLTFDDEDLINEKIYTIYCKMTGEVYATTAKFYKNVKALPTVGNAGEVAFVTGENAEGKAYQHNGTTWVEFEDVPLGQVYRHNNQTDRIVQFPCNNNFLLKCLDNEVWIHKESIQANYNYVIPHGLNIENTYEYHCDCQLLCINADGGYLPGEFAMCPMVVFSASDNVKDAQPYLTTEYIGLHSGSVGQGFGTIDKTTGDFIQLAENCWNIVFRIWK